MSAPVLQYVSKPPRTVCARQRQPRSRTPRTKVLTLFGTRPEIIKLAPVISELELRSDQLQVVNVTSAQHTDLLYPLVELFKIRIDHNLDIMQHGQTPNQVCARVLESLDPILNRESPDMIIVQGDTTTAMAGALAGFHRSIPVGHVEAGLRSGNDHSPFPEEMNRKLITRLATHHFAATESNRRNLLEEGVLDSSIFVTGNPVVDALHRMRQLRKPSVEMARLLQDTERYKRVVLTTHRRESFGAVMRENLRAISKFVQRHDDVAVVFPVHPNPEVMKIAQQEFSRQQRVFLIAPLGYEEFIDLLENSWLIVSDSGGVQEEAPTLRKPLLVIRENTERPEAVQAGIARLVGFSAARLTMMLEEAYSEGSWVTAVSKANNPFGCGDSGKRIVDIIAALCESFPQYDLQVAAD